MTIKLRYAWNQKSWFTNLNNVIINYLHKSETQDIYLIHMSRPKCRINRTCCHSRVWRWR